MEFRGSWDTHLPLMEFAYNNSYQANIGIALMRLFMDGNVELQFVGTR